MVSTKGAKRATSRVATTKAPKGRATVKGNTKATASSSVSIKRVRRPRVATNGPKGGPVRDSVATSLKRRQALDKALRQAQTDHFGSLIEEQNPTDRWDRDEVLVALGFASMFILIGVLIGGVFL